MQARIALRVVWLGMALAVAGSATARADLAYVTDWGTAGTGDGQFTTPSSVASDGAGTVYVSDAAANRVQRFAAAEGAFLGQFGGPGSALGQFSGAGDVAADGFQSVYVTDPGNFRLQKFTSDGRPIEPWGSAGTNDGQFREPSGVATDSLGRVFVVDAQSNRVQRFTPDLAFDVQWGRPGIGRGEFSSAQDVAVDVFGDVYVLDSVANRVQKFTAEGTWLDTWGTPGSNDGQFDAPLGIGTDGAGRVYVADTGNDRIQVFAFDGTFLSQFGGTGGGRVGFNRPVDVASDVTGDVFVVDQGNRRVVKLAEPSPPLPPPIPFKTANVVRVSGSVLVQRPGSASFVALEQERQIPIGSHVKADDGTVRLTTASNLRGGQQTARFYEGQFTIEQPRTPLPVTELKLRGGGFERCTRGAGARGAVALHKKRAKRRPRRSLWGDGKGRFKTRGRYGTAGVRGTRWLTQDTCDATLIRVKNGRVEVRDLVRGRTVSLEAGEAYTARRR